MKITPSETRTKFPLSERKIIKKTVTGTIAWIILLLIVWGIIALLNTTSNTTEFVSLYTFASLSIWGIIIIAILLTYLYQRWYFATYFYDLTQDFIIIKKGPITPTEITIPYERVQDIYVDQDIFDRIFGIYDVHLSSATISSGMEAHIDGVEQTQAEGLRNQLLATVRQKIGKKSTPVTNL